MEVMRQRQEASRTMRVRTRQDPLTQGSDPNLTVVQFEKEVETSEGAGGGDDEEVAVVIRIVSWTTTRKGYVVPIGEDGRVQRRDFGWQKKKYKDEQFDVGTTVVVHPDIGITEARLPAERRQDRRPALVPPGIVRLMKMWERAACSGSQEASGASDKLDVCIACGTAASHGSIGSGKEAESAVTKNVRTCALCLQPLHLACGEKVLEFVALATDGPERPTKPTLVLPSLFGVSSLCPLCQNWLHQ